MRGLVSILIPAFNAGPALENAIKSCLEQTYRNTELIVLNNGSDDGSFQLISKITDPRLKILIREENLGIAPARNILLKEARGEYIAWLDADDLMFSNRIEKQVGYMEKHPEIDVLGSWIRTDDSTLPLKRLPLKHNEIATCLWFKNGMIQPSILSRNFYRSENLFYDENYKNSVEDYELWYRLSKFKTFANQPEFLMKYHMTIGIDLDIKKRNNDFEKNLQRLWDRKWADIQLDPDPKDKQSFQEFLYSNRRLGSRELNSLAKTLKLLKERNTDSFFRCIISLQYLRLWRNMSMVYKILNLHLLWFLKDYPRMKSSYLV